MNNLDTIRAQVEGRSDSSMSSASSIEERLNDLYERYQPAIYRRLLYLVQHPEIAEELCQETFIRAWQALPRYVEGNLYGWLYQIATNVARDNLRQFRTRMTYGEIVSYELVVANGHDFEDEQQVLDPEAIQRRVWRAEAWRRLNSESKQTIIHHLERRPVAPKDLYAARRCFKEMYQRVEERSMREEIVA